MRFSKLFITATVLFISQLVFAEDGRHCQEHLSAVCPLATFFSAANGAYKTTTIMQGLRDAMYHTTKSDSTQYKEGDHIICVGTSLTLNIPVLGRLVPLELEGGIPYGGICVFAEHMKGQTTITLGQAKKLADSLLDNKCITCGIIPIGWPKDTNDNDPVLKFDFVASPTCTGTCITSDDIVVAAASAPTVTTTATATVQSVKTLTQSTFVQSMKSIISVSVQTVTRSTGPTVGTGSAVQNAPSSTATAQSFVQPNNATTFSCFSLLALLLQMFLLALA